MALLKQFNLKPNQWFTGRLLVQMGFLFVCIWIGWEFVRFVDKLNNGEPVSFLERPPGVEGFLPISSLMELWLWIKTGILMHIHPAGVVILLFAITSAILLRRGFCSWLCPIGTLSEGLWRFGKKLGFSWQLPKWLDIPLRSLKYVLLAFFLYAIFGMSSQGLMAFIGGDYNRVSDIKMLDFFAAPSRLTLSVLGYLILLSILIQNFWCRFLCPYGALLGLLARLSPMAIRRDAETCIDCDLCNKTCPAILPVATTKTIFSEECLACQQCCTVCPVENCLQFSLPRQKRPLRPIWYGILFMLLFLGSIGTAKITGFWYSETTIEEYRTLNQERHILDHPRSVSAYK